MAKQREKESRKRYSVEWIGRVPLDEYGDNDLHNATTEVREFSSMGLAVAFARRLWREGRVKAGDVEIDVEYLVPSGTDCGWYAWAGYVVRPDGSYERHV